MIFSTFDFFIFFGVVVLFLSYLQNNNHKKFLLLAASYFFYGYWDWRFTFLMAAMTAINYYIGVAITQLPKWRTPFLWAAIVVDLGTLGFFKYFNFFIESANALIAPLGLHLGTLNIILPIGISFITFQVMAYVIDVYQRVTPPAESIWEFALLTSFFPQLVAGPILKAQQFLPELKKPIVFKRVNFIQGGQLFLLGFLRKVLIADRLALFVDKVFESPQDYHSMTLWLAVIAYAIQIYCDFSGYSDMAIGCAKCFGYDIPINFNIPYISRSITEFWRRWHISLSTWLREYLYIPLGGNRHGKARQIMNLLIVMLLGGLWHGASWNFVVWGALHGSALATHKIYGDYVAPRLQIHPYISSALAWISTLLFVCLSWIFFRAADFSVAFTILQKMFALSDIQGIQWQATSLKMAIPGMILADYLGHLINQGKFLQFKKFSEWFWLWFWLMGCLFLAPHNPQPFVYFQF
jgi:alginate O-acetyltransferase complex protein AlgI